MRIFLSILTLIAFQAQASVVIVDYTYSLVCLGSPTTFTSTSVVDGGTTITNWEWDFGDGNGFVSTIPASPVITYQFNTLGPHTVVLRITTDDSGSPTKVHQITVNPVPSADFSAPDVCAGSFSVLTDQSSIVSGDNVSWEWEFLNADNLYDDASGQNVSHNFLVSGVYNVGLLVTSDKGCQSTTSKDVTVDPMPVVSFSVEDVCLGDETEFTGISSIASGLVTDYDWELNGNGFFDDTSGMVITNQFVSDGNYQIGLQVTSDQGCVRDTFQLVTIAPYPYVNFSFDDGCQNTDIQFTNLTGNVVGTISYEWIFAVGDTVTDVNPSHAFTTSGVNAVQLIGTTSFGCADTLVQNVDVYPTPLAGFSAAGVCWGDITNFVNETDPKGSVIQDYTWFFGDNTQGVGEDPSHEYMAPDSFLVMLVATTTDNCMDTSESYVHVWQLPQPVATASDSAFCFGEETTLSVDPAGVTRLWSTADMTSSIIVDTTGVYQVRIVDANGCEGADTIFVRSWLLPELTITNDTAINLGSTIQLEVSGADTYVWVQDIYLDDATSATPLSLPKEDITYVVTGTQVNPPGAANGDLCKSTVQVSIEVIPNYDLHPVNLFTPDNGDDVNNTFYIGNIECYPDCKVTVYNRWGLEVFSGQPYINHFDGFGNIAADESAWDGTFNDEKLPDGTYYYVIECDGRDGRFDGAVTILRNKKL